jgi:ribonuclease J
MEIDIKKHSEKLLFIPLGGIEKIGMNFYAYHYKGKWLIVDMGLGFAEQEIPGVEILLPLPTFIEKYKDDIVGLILTHAHEDHIGAVPYLWDKIGCKIYTSTLTAALLKTKLAEFEMEEEVQILEVKENETINLEPFSLDFVHMTHSIPEMYAVLISTEQGSIFHTGDWKLDAEPILGKVTDLKKLRSIGKKGVLALTCDSTNIFNEDRSGSEGELSKSLNSLIDGCPKDGLIVVTTFASNLMRLHSIAKAAEAVGRKVILAGRSLWRLYNAALECGYLSDLQECISASEIGSYGRNEVLIICTGCQGEVLAAATKISTNSHPDIKMHRGDTIIFSSKIIPGNERRIFNLFNRFCKLGVDIMTERDHFVHVSGHPSQVEIGELYKLLRPKIVIPVHGEPAHLHEHCKFAKSQGIKHTLEVESGDVIHISEKGPEKLGKVEVGTLVVDGNIVIDEYSPIIQERKIMSNGGVVAIFILVNQRGKLLRQPKITAPGLLDYEEDRELYDSMIEKIRDTFPNNRFNTRRTGEKSVKKIIGTMIKKMMRFYRKKDPYVIVQIEQMSI